MLTNTHLISTSNPASPNELQPVMEVGETSEQPSWAAPLSNPRVVMIQSPHSGEDAEDTTEFEPGIASTERRKRKKEKKPKKGKNAKCKK